jgi:uncharacterized protein YlbG (UPF0298 family)
MLLRVDTNLITIHKNLTVTNHFGRIFKDMIEQKRTIRRTARAIQINHVRQSSVRIIMIVEAAVQETTRRTRATKKIKNINISRIDRISKTLNQNSFSEENKNLYHFKRSSRASL